MLILWHFPLSLSVDLAFKSRSMFDDVICVMHNCTMHAFHNQNALIQHTRAPNASHSNLHLGGHIYTFICGVSFIFTLPSIIWVFICRLLSLCSVFLVKETFHHHHGRRRRRFHVAIKTLPSVATGPIRSVLSARLPNYLWLVLFNLI